MKSRLFLLFFLLFNFLLSYPVTFSHAIDNEKVMIVFDASGSMWGRIDGETKIEIAKSTILEILSNWPREKKLGLVAYGHRREADCEDIETIIKPASLNLTQVKAKLKEIRPKGKTPLSLAVKKAAQELDYTKHPSTVILISDGIETCGFDPCKIGQSLKELGINFKTHVIGFDVTTIEDQKGLRCLAETTGGIFIPAGNAHELKKALEATVNESPETLSKPTASSLPIPSKEAYNFEISLPKTSIKAPNEAVKTSEIKVKHFIEKTNSSEESVEDIFFYGNLTGSLVLYAENNKTPILSVGVIRNDKGEILDTKMLLPAKTGNFKIIWETTQNNKRINLAQAPLKIVDAEILIDAPQTAEVATSISIRLIAPPKLNGSINLYSADFQDQLLGVPVLTESGGKYSLAEMTLPNIPGNYVLKWVSLSEDILASKPLEIIKSNLVIETLDKAPIASEIPVNVKGPENMGGWVYLYKRGSNDSLDGNPVSSAANQHYEVHNLTLPAKAGEYELRWLTDAGELLASTTISAENAGFVIRAPKKTKILERIEVGLEGPKNIRGWVYLYPKGQEEYLTGNPISNATKDGYEIHPLSAPESPGIYLLKWETNNKETLAETSIEVMP